MNIILKELRFGYKPFLFWLLGQFFLTVAGLAKYTGIQGGMDIGKLLDQFPRIILAVLGMGGGVDLTSLPGYYSVLRYYVFVLAILLAIHLGSSAVNRELIDRTYDFIYAKPRTRSFILLWKLGAGFAFLAVFCLMNIPYRYAGMRAINIQPDDFTFVYIYTAAVFLVAFLFFGMGDGQSLPHHHPGFDMDEKALPQATLLLTALVLEFQEQEKQK